MMMLLAIPVVVRHSTVVVVVDMVYIHLTIPPTVQYSPAVDEMADSVDYTSDSRCFLLLHCNCILHHW